jgi:hypothetical protein
MQISIFNDLMSFFLIWWTKNPTQVSGSPEIKGEAGRFGDMTCRRCRKGLELLYSCSTQALPSILAA